MDGGVTMTKYSILIPVYNGAKYIEKCLNSVLDQSYEDYEVILVNDGSTDNTKEIAKGFTNKIFDFNWINDFSAARNHSFSKATMDYILWLDADDVILEEDRTK